MSKAAPAFDSAAPIEAGYFIPVANTRRVLIDSGEHEAMCTGVHQLEMYRKFQRWYMRVDFKIADVVLVCEYLNLGTGETPNMQLGPRTEYYKLWAIAKGRKPEENEPMDPRKIIGVEFLVTVADKSLGGDGEAYSTVTSVRLMEPERLSA